MSRILAIDWDQYEVRVLVAHIQGANLRVEQMLTEPMRDRAGRRLHAGTTSGTTVSDRSDDDENRDNDREDQPAAPPDPGQTLRRLLQRVASVPGTVLVGIGRSAVDAFPLSLPPAKDSELPGLVQVQAMQESSLLSEDAVCDYAILSGKPGNRRDAIGFVLSEARLREIRGICTVAGIKPTRILIRLFGSAAFYRQIWRRMDADSPSLSTHGGDSDGRSTPRSTLLVSRCGDEADLLVMTADEIQLTRTVRLPSEDRPELVVQRLAGEVHRTFVVAETGVLAERGGGIARILLLTTPEESNQLLPLLRHLEDSVRIEIFSPLDLPAVPENGELPEHPGRFASLLGLVLDDGLKKHAVDFLHPRRPPPPPNYRRIAMLAAALVAIVAGGLYWNRTEQYAELDSQILDRQHALQKLETHARKVLPARILVEEIGQWENSQIVCLDELQDLSTWFPSTRDAIVTEYSIAPGRTGPEMRLRGQARNSESVTYIIDQFRARGYDCQVRNSQLRQLGGQYSWSFELLVPVRPRRDVPEVTKLEQKSASKRGRG